MSNFTRLVPSLLLKGLCSNFNADIYILREEIFWCVYIIYYIVSAAGVCFIFARREYPLHTSSHSYPFITRPACARPGTRGGVLTRSRPRLLSVEIGGDGNSSMQCVSEFASENARRCAGVAPSCAGSRQKKCICIIFISILDLFILGIYSSFDCRLLLPLVVGLLNFVLSSTQKHCAQASLRIQKRKLYNSTGFKFN